MEERTGRKMVAKVLALALLAMWFSCYKVGGKVSLLHKGESRKFGTGVIPAGRLSSPSQVSVQIFRWGRYSHGCSGLLFHPSKVLTAGSCILNSSKDELLVIAGKYQQFLNATGDYLEQAREVAATIWHPNFISKPLDYDYAVIVVDEPFETSKAVIPYNLPLPSEGNFVEKDCITMGWFLDHSLEGHENTLQVGPVTLMDKSACAQNLTGHYTERFHCSNGIRYYVDFGGLLVCGNDSTLEGLTPLQVQGRGPGGDHHPIIFSDIQYALRWLNDSGI